MHVLLTYKFKMDLTNSDLEEVETSIFKCSRATNSWSDVAEFQTIGFKLLYKSSLPARMKRIRSNSRENVETPFSLL